MSKPTIICLTPVKNEAWILDKFLKATDLWADHIIIADQMSTDGSREIALKYPKVRLIDNKSEQFNEPERQKLLIDEARKIEGNRLLITLDADEIFSPEIFDSKEWQQVLSSEPGTVIHFQWANLCTDMKKMWYASYFPWGYMDDGSEHNSQNTIHNTRIPMPQGCKKIVINDFKVMHLQYVNWERMESKHRWYQCYEKVTYPNKNAVDIFRMYHHMFGISKQQYVDIPNQWIDYYKKKGIDLSLIEKKTKIWFDEKVLDLFDQYGTTYFKRLRIWSVNWQEIAKKWGRTDVKRYKDPRSLLDKIIQWWLLKTQPYCEKKNIRRIDRLIARFLKYR